MNKTLQEIKKITYLNCEQDGHEQEPLSRICIDENCSRKTLICALCEAIDHKDHETLPLKTYLQKVYGEKEIKNKKKPKKEDINPIYLINQIDDIYNSFFGVVSAYRNEVLDMLYSIQTQGKMFFNRIRQQIKHLIKLENPLEFIQKQKQTQSRLKEYFLQMTKSINLKNNEVFSLSTKLEEVVNSCKDKEKKLLDTLNKNASNMQRELEKISISLDQSSMFQMKNPTFFWSENFKGHKVKINGLIAEQTGMESSGQRFALIEPSLNLYGSKKICWGIKVIKFVGWVGVGICLKSQISKANYHFNYGNTGHGSYLISTNGYSWSHSVKEFNSAYKSFLFNVNDTIFVQYDPSNKKLTFKKNKTTEQFTLDIVDPPANDEFYPCANICSNGDTVEIVNEIVEFN